MADRRARFGLRGKRATRFQLRKRSRFAILWRLRQNKTQEFPNRERGLVRADGSQRYLVYSNLDSEIPHFVRDDKSCAPSADSNLKIDFFTRRCAPKKSMSWRSPIG